MRQRTEITRPKGINSDLSEFELAPDVWSDGNNVNFRRLRTNNSVGYSNPFVVEDLLIEPTFVMSYITATGENRWVYAGISPSSMIYTTEGASVVEIGTGYAATRDASWTGIDFNSVLIMNNRNDHPVAIPDPYTTAQPLPNWGTVAPWGIASRCEVMRSYKNYLLALDCYDETGERFDNMIRWSSPAELGDVPPSWDPYDPAEQAGLYTLSDTPGRIIDGRTLGDYFMVYKTDAVWMLQFVGGEFIFSFRKLFSDSAGILAKDCVAEFDGQHFVLSPDGAYVHNGASRTEVMEKWVKDELFLNVNPAYLSETKVVADHDKQEIWIYFISKDAVDEGDGPFADRALIWNWDIQEWTKKELNGISYIASGQVVPLSTGPDGSWDSDPQAWDQDQTRWDGDVVFNQNLDSLLLANYYDKKFFADGYTLGNDYWNPLSWVRRTGIDFGSDRDFKLVTRCVPHIIGQNPITIKFYASDVQTPDPVLIETTTFDPTVDVDVDCHVQGRYIGVQFESDELWTLTGYTLEWEPQGKF